MSSAQGEPAVESLPLSIGERLTALVRGARPEEARPVGAGWNAVAWRLPAEDRDWLLRIPKLPGAIKEIERQTCLYRELEQRGLSVPADAQLLTDDAGTVIGGLYRFAEGEPANRRTNRGRRRIQLAADLARVIRKIHSTPLLVVGACGIEPRDKWSRYEQWMQRHQSHFGPVTTSYLAMLRVRWAALTDQTPIPRTLIHADLAPEHLIVDEHGALVSVLDFGGPQMADPAFDFASLGKHYGWPLADRVLVTYANGQATAIRARARLYERVLPLHAVAAGVERDEPELLRQGLRQLAAQAAAHRDVEHQRAM